MKGYWVRWQRVLGPLARSIGLGDGFKGYWVERQGCQGVLVWVASNIGSGVKDVKVTGLCCKSVKEYWVGWKWC